MSLPPRDRGLSEGEYRCGKSAPAGRTFSLAVRAPPSTTAVVFPAGQVSPAGSVGASAFGRGVHRTPAPFEKVSLHPVKTFRTGDRCDACDGYLVYSRSSVTPVTSVTLFEIQHPRFARSCRLEINPRRVQNFIVVMHDGFCRRDRRGLLVSERVE